MIRKRHRGTILLVIINSWLVPCHGFAYTALHCSSSRHASLVASPGTAHAPLTCATRRRAQPSLSMSNEGGGFNDPYGDEATPPPGRAGDDGGSELSAPAPYRDEHTSGASKFRDLLNRAKKVNPSAEGAARAPPPSRPQPAQPRRPLPTRPANAPNYDDDSLWEDEPQIGSPDLPDPPLRNEMPGLNFGSELDDGRPSEGGEREGEGVSVGGGSRFQRMMNQAEYNDQRQEAGVGPRVSPRSPGGKPRAEVLTRDEKQRALSEAVDRQQKLMSAARGFDLDDPTLDGPALAKKKALSRAQAEATAGGYVPSSKASDDYLDALKSDSKRKNKELHAKLSGRPVPPEPRQPAPRAPGDEDTGPYEPQYAQDDDQRQSEYVPQRRRHSTSSIQNESDAYLAGLSGIKIDLDSNPYLKKQRQEQASASAGVAKNVLKLTPPSGQKGTQPPLSPTMTYAEKLAKAREAKASGSAGTSPSTAAAAAAASSPVVSSPPSAPQAPPAAPTVSYSEKLKQAREAKDTESPAVSSSTPAPPVTSAPVVTSAVPPARTSLEQQVTEDAVLVTEDATRAKVTRVVDMLAERETTGKVDGARAAELRSALIDTQETLRAETYGSSEAAVAPAAPTNPSIDDEDVTQAKIMRVMDLLTEHKTAGLVGEERVAELREALVDTREALRAETYGRNAPATTTISPPLAEVARSAPAGGPTSSAQPQRLVQPPAQPAPIDAEAKDTLSRCSILLGAHVHTTLKGQDLQALREGLASSLAIVEAQIAGTGAQSAQQVRQAPSGAEYVGDGVVPESVNGMQSVGEVLSDMGVGKKPESFEPENDSGGDKGWAGGSLGEYEKSVATKGLGYLLKHRGGKGYGRGRLTGREAEVMVSTLAELTDILQEEMVDN